MHKRLGRRLLKHIRSISPVSGVSLALGVSLTLLIVGVGAWYEALAVRERLAVAPFGQAIVTGAALMLVAAGLRLPRSAALRVQRALWRRIARGATVIELRPSEPRAGAFHLLLVAGVCLIAGLCMAVGPVWLRLCDAIMRQMLDRFLWSAGPLAVLQAVLLLLAAGMPLVLLGTAAACTHRVSRLRKGWDFHQSGWMLTGRSPCPPGPPGAAS